jgi:hypothetical protein
MTSWFAAFKKYAVVGLAIVVRKSVNEYKGDENRRNNSVTSILIHMLRLRLSTASQWLFTLITYTFHKTEFFYAGFHRL